MTKLADAIVNAISVNILLWKDATPYGSFPRDVLEPVKIELPRILVRNMPRHVLSTLGYTWVDNVSNKEPWNVDAPALFKHFIEKVSDDPVAIELVIDVLQHEAYRDCVLSMIKYTHKPPTMTSDDDTLVDLATRVSRAVGYEPTNIQAMAQTIKEQYTTIHSELIRL
jgi:hypothetical protein